MLGSYCVGHRCTHTPILCLLEPKTAPIPSLGRSSLLACTQIPFSANFHSYPYPVQRHHPCPCIFHQEITLPKDPYGRNYFNITKTPAQRSWVQNACSGYALMKADPGPGSACVYRNHSFISCDNTRLIHHSFRPTAPFPKLFSPQWLASALPTTYSTQTFLFRNVDALQKVSSYA